MTGLRNDPRGHGHFQLVLIALLIALVLLLQRHPGAPHVVWLMLRRVTRKAGT